MKKRKTGFIIPLERAIVRASKAVGKSERMMKSIRRDFANIRTSKGKSLHAQKNST
jgi:ribosomal protein L29